LLAVAESDDDAFAMTLTQPTHRTAKFLAATCPVTIMNRDLPHSCCQPSTRQPPTVEQPRGSTG
jgi:hypothetical protein